eukprot:TRINITY_DN21509_c0_g1_i7.p1 TRINITY_DN21509_c0_g1~~TRINITY_DN21509_c0_g1_i7.p1  ORF type:complete len:142 (-),score=12.17 TRINITY_DN21509_c0_g1_i7:17-442(-)
MSDVGHPTYQNRLADVGPLGTQDALELLSCSGMLSEQATCCPAAVLQTSSSHADDQLSRVPQARHLRTSISIILSGGRGRCAWQLETSFNARGRSLLPHSESRSAAPEARITWQSRHCSTLRFFRSLVKMNVLLLFVTSCS